MDQRIQQIFDYIDRHETDMVHLLRNIVSIESPSSNVEANAHIAAHLDTYCDAIGMDRKIFQFDHAGPTFTAWTNPGPQKPVALIGHYDTVHTVGSFGSDPFRIVGDTVYGPGVFDMKGGVVIALFAIRALLAAGYRERQIKLVLSGDEEVAHAYSEGEGGHLMELFTDDCAAVFNCESGQPNSEVTIQRKGGAIFGIRVYGKAAHAGKEPWKGASAIRQAAEMITEIERHSDFNGASYNCGRISGGKGANVVPDYCELIIGLRYVTNEQYQQAYQLVSNLCEHPVVPGTRCEMDQRGFYPAMELTPKTYELLNIYQQSCQLLGLPLPQGIAQGGCSDSAFATRMGIPALCSLGVDGDGAHALDEHARISSLTTQCKKLAASILMLPENF